jgi:hypothetical protein
MVLPEERLECVWGTDHGQPVGARPVESVQRPVAAASNAPTAWQATGTSGPAHCAVRIAACRHRRLCSISAAAAATSGRADPLVIGRWIPPRRSIRAAIAKSWLPGRSRTHPPAAHQWYPGARTALRSPAGLQSTRPPATTTRQGAGYLAAWILRPPEVMAWHRRRPAHAVLGRYGSPDRPVDRKAAGP